MNADYRLDLIGDGCLQSFRAAVTGLTSQHATAVYANADVSVTTIRDIETSPRPILGQEFRSNAIEDRVHNLGTISP
jgi:hypothetical protein